VDNDPIQTKRRLAVTPIRPFADTPFRKNAVSATRLRETLIAID
jgi:hypothetical protein